MHEKSNKPIYENLVDTTTLEYGLSKELTEIVNELQTLAKNVQDLDNSFIGKMKRKAITWEEVAEELESLQKQIQNTTDFILEKFD
jgi:peptidoglycan hydrolase CwlO-like protein